MKKVARPRVVIVGAGFGGLAAAKRLSGKAVDVTVVDRRNHHLFQPLLYQVATAALSPADIAAPVRSILSKAPNVRVVLDEAIGVDPPQRLVELGSGASLEYDWLILATGARHSYFGRDDWAANAPGLKSIEDATAIRRKILLALERAESETDPDTRRALLTFVVIGAGPTGVEMAGAIAELARRSVSKDFRSITPHCSRVILIEAGERVLPAFPSSLSDAARRSLEDLGVEVRLRSPVLDVGSGYVQLGNELILGRTIVWAAGVEASPAAEWLDAEHDTSGRVFVEPDLRVSGQERIFAIGDTANAAGQDRRALPAIAPVAKQQGQYVADIIMGRPALAFKYRDFGNLATIGRSKAVIDWGQVRMSGFIAWLIWSVAHIWFLVGFRSRIAVGISWLWSYATYQRSARLITGDHPIPPSQPRRPQALERKCA
ncbi:NAD(P)/FAD-dependent oxidoreductase [Sphingomonas daechungensis]|uniref:NAD(P)/FAD-dependent oxidoreductase n=1 Tax=Sphingomonas daechungensis TaxID=1176646 RepID=UPI003783EEED